MNQEEIQQQVNEWYRTYSNDVYNFVYFMLGDHNQAKDILQDTFLRAYDNFDSFEEVNIKSWLFRVARNLTIDYIRKKKPISYYFDVSPFTKATEQTPEQMALLNESEQELYAALNRIKRTYRDVIILRKIKDFSIKETADVLDWTENKVKINLLRGLEALRRELEKEGYVHETL